MFWDVITLILGLASVGCEAVSMVLAARILINYVIEEPKEIWKYKWHNTSERDSTAYGQRYSRI